MRWSEQQPVPDFGESALIAARANATGFFLKEDYALNYRRLMEKVLEIQAAVTQPERL